MLDWLERHDLDKLWDGVHFIGTFQFLAEAVRGDNSPDTLKGSDEHVPGLTSGNSSDMESRLKEAFLKNADNNSKVAVRVS